MSHKRFCPLTLELIDEGRLLEGIEADLLNIQKAMVEYRNQWQDRAKGTKAKLTLTITVQCESPDDELFTIKGETKVALPGRPASTSVGMPADDDDGQPRLFVRRSGSDAVTPRQGKVCTDDGRSIDQETGEVLDTP